MKTNLLKILFDRLRKGEENIKTLSLRPLFFLNPKYLFSKKYDILNDDWDILLVLDACRYDYFKKVNPIKGQLKKVVSKGTQTVEWSRRNFECKACDNIIYISANPQVSHPKIESDWKCEVPFKELHDVWLTDWDEELKTVTPETLNAYLLKNIKAKGKSEYRYIVHYMQPHIPFIGEKRIEMAEESMPNTAWWRLMKKNKGSLDKVKEAYASNLERVLKSIQNTISELPSGKKVVITSDHGEAFGEYGVFAHPPMMYMNELIEVPHFSFTT